MTNSWQFHSILQRAWGSREYLCHIYGPVNTYQDIYFTHRYPERFSDLPVVTQQVSDRQGLGTVQVVMKLKCFGSDRRVQPKDVGPGAGSAA